MSSTSPIPNAPADRGARRRPRVLILHKYDLAKYPYRSWIGPDAHLTLIAPDSALSAAEGAPAPDLADYDEIVRFASVDEYADSGLVELEAIQRHAAAPFDRVIAIVEFDVRRAAQLRDLFRAPGQRSESATAYRDKFVMKSRLRDAGIPVADYLLVDTPSDLVNAFYSLGQKIVVKPRWGAGSVGMTVLNSPMKLRDYIASHLPVNEDRPANLLAERFVQHKLHHIDGFVLERDLVFASASCMSPLLDFGNITTSFSSGATTFSAMHEWNSKAHRDLVRLTSEAVRALPAFDDGMIHAEIFETPDGALVFNEIGARLGGLRIRGAVKESFGVDLVECAVRAQMGQPLRRLFDDARNGPRHLAGFAAFPGREGRLLQVSPQHPFPWVVDYQLLAKVGERLDAAEGSTDYFASVVVVGSDSSQVNSRLKEFESWFWQGTRIDAAS